MTAFASLPTTDRQALDAIRDLLAKLLESGLVDGVLVAMENRDGWSIHPTLVTDAARMERVNPLLPIMPISAARMATLLLERPPEAPEEGYQPARRIAAVLRPCELRAAIELAKLKQIDLGQLLTVGIDCVGTYEAANFKLATEKQLPEASLDRVLGQQRLGSPDAVGELPYRHACSICVTPTAWNADLSIHLIGVEGTRLLVEGHDGSILERLGLVAGADASSHGKAVEGLLQVRRERRQKDLDAFAGSLKSSQDGVPGLIVAFQACQRCHNCTVACPICYCRNCLFRTDTMVYEPERYFSWARRKGAARLPGDVVAFQLTRLAHVSASCVGCGLCTSACPADLPIDSLFQSVARKTQGLLEYVPGKDVQEPPPGSSFRQDEFVRLGEVEK